MSAQRDLIAVNESGATDALPRCKRDAFADYGRLTGPRGEYAQVAEGHFGARWGFKPDPQRAVWFVVVDLAARPPRCSRCGARSLGVPGGTHYQVRTRADEPRKTEGKFTRASSCGTWEVA